MSTQLEQEGTVSELVAAPTPQQGVGPHDQPVNTLMTQVICPILDGIPSKQPGFFFKICSPRLCLSYDVLCTCLTFYARLSGWCILGRPFLRTYLSFLWEILMKNEDEPCQGRGNGGGVFFESCEESVIWFQSFHFQVEFQFLNRLGRDTSLGMRILMNVGEDFYIIANSWNKKSNVTLKAWK